MEIYEKVFYVILNLLPGMVFFVLFLSYNFSLKRKISNFELIFKDSVVIKKYVEIYKRPRKKTSDDKNTSGNELATKADIQDLFRNVYYSKKSFLFPIMVLSFVTIIGTLTIFVKLNFDIKLFGDYVQKVKNIDVEIIFAFLGAYLWGLNDILDRKRNIDLTPTSLHYIWLRILMVSVLGFIIAKMNLPVWLSLTFSFSLGLFPINAIKKILQNLAKKYLKGYWSPQVSDENERVEFKSLDGLSLAHSKRLQEENIFCNNDLAYCDPILLYLRTNIEWKVILDLVDQSILYCYINSSINELRKVGIRGAIEAATLFYNYEEKSKQAESTVKYVAKVLKIDEDCVLYLLNELHSDLHVQYFWALWETTVLYDETKMIGRSGLITK